MISRKVLGVSPARPCTHLDAAESSEGSWRSQPSHHFWQASQASDLHEPRANLRFYRNLQHHLWRPFPGRSSESHTHDPVRICTPRHEKSRRSDGVLRRLLSQVGATSYATVGTRSEIRQPNMMPPESQKALHVLLIACSSTAISRTIKTTSGNWTRKVRP